MRYLKIFENFSENKDVQDLWKINSEDNMHLVISCMEETGLYGVADYEILYAVLEIVEMRRAPGLPSYGSKHFRACFVQDTEKLRTDDIYTNVDPEFRKNYIKKLREKGPSEDFMPIIEVSLTNLDDEHEEQVAEFGRIYGERFRELFGDVYNIEESEWGTTDGYSIRLHMVI
jgi:hypothetical protein